MKAEKEYLIIVFYINCLAKQQKFDCDSVSPARNIRPRTKKNDDIEKT